MSIRTKGTARLILLIVAVASPGFAQDIPAGRVGERQAAGQVDEIVVPGRIDSRIQSRVQSRIRNRIDRYYDPRGNAVSPFEVAGDQARTAGRPRPRR